MDDPAARRRELLRQTRRLYEDEHFLPAIHPRYGNLYHELYGEEDPARSGGSFFLRLGIGILCFVCYVWIDTGNIKVADVSSSRIVEQTERQTNMEDWEEVWKNL